MKFFVHRYLIRFSDTMAYGTHHFLTNFQFQCAAREALLFLRDGDGSESWRSAIEPVELLTQQGYSRNLSALGLGDWALVLMSADEVGVGSFQLCFRVLSSAGTPVACGYQNIVVLDRGSRRVTRVPALIASRLEPLAEPERPRFAEAARRGGSALKQLFPEAVCRLGRELLAGGGGSFAPLDASGCVSLTEATAAATADAAAQTRAPASTPAVAERSSSASTRAAPNADLPLVLVCAGQGSLDAEWTWQLARRTPDNRHLLDAVQSLCEERTIGDYAGWLRSPAPSSAGLEGRLFEQLTIYLGALFTGRALLERRERPAWILGHSFGEITAAVLGGMLDAESGARVVAARTEALLGMSEPGGLLALSARTPELECELERLRRESPELYLAVRNHPSQWLLAGRTASLERCAERARSRGIGAALLPGSAFHSPLLMPAAVTFRAAIAGLELVPPQVPVFSPFERREVRPDEDWASLWASHLVRSLDFEAGVSTLLAGGDHRFTLCARRSGLARVLEALTRGRASEVSTADAALGDELPRGSTRGGEMGFVPQAAASAAKAAGAPRHVSPASPSREREPLAIVGVGCCLPGAEDFAAYARLLESGACAITDRRSVDPELARDFLAPNGVTPDKTYTLLSGHVHEAVAGGSGPRSRLAASKVLRLAAAALNECRASVELRAADRGEAIGVVIGSTADGCAEYDAALALERLRSNADARSPELERAIARELDELGSSQALAHHPALRDLARELFGGAVRSLIVDAACASSLYALDVAARWLETGESSLVFAGGAFAPGLSNNCLFAQFSGLTRSESLPLDARASGVVFGEGAAFVALRPLRAAIENGDPIWGVVRGIGLSSDGQSSSPSAPKAAGQTLALQRAYARSGVDPRSVQYVEAHATGTPVGDATELEALQGFYRAAGAGAGSLGVGSVKSQISHVGWAAGVASLLKVLAAFRARQLPVQRPFERPNPRLDLAHGPLRIVTATSAWPDNDGAQPRRAAINGFGFGGTNSHVIVDAFEPSYHGALVARARPERARAACAKPGRQCVARAELSHHPAQSGGARLPWPRLARPLLPDVIESMDASQEVAVALAARCLEPLGERWREHRQRIGVIVGMAGKTQTLVSANDRIYSQRLQRTLAAGAPAGHAAALVASIQRWADRQAPSTPYTLTGGMPNLAAGRVCQVLDLSGPNLVIDADADSFAQASDYAAQLIDDQTCDFVLALGLARSPDDAGIVGQAQLWCARELAARYHLEEVVTAASSTAAPEAPDAGTRLGAPAPIEGHESGGSVAARAWGPAVSDSPEREPGGSVAARAPVEVRVPVLVEHRSPGVSRSSREPLLLLGLDAARRERLAADLRAPHVVPFADAGDLLEARIRGSSEPVQALLVTDLSGDVRALLEPGTRRERDVLAPLLELCQRHYQALGAGRLQLASLSANAWAAPDLPRPETGLLGGFVKALCRELPQARLVQVHADADVAAGVAVALGSLGSLDGPRELFVAGGVTRTLALAPAPELAHGAPPFDRDSVLVITAGARGISAELVPWLLQRFQCRLALIGRSDPERTPAAWRDLTPAEVEAQADVYYRQAASSGATLRSARRTFRELCSSHEVQTHLRRFAALPGDVRYHVCDLTRAGDVEACVQAIAREHGRIDGVLHGAGLQVSSTLPKKTPETFWSVVDSKLLSLRNLLAAIEARLPGKPPHVHLATSAFSYFGNDGQHDYGATNEALNRLAQCLSSPHASWSSLAWLAWDNIGMTRGSEYQTLARARDMRALRAEEGRELFGRLFSGAPRHAAHILLTEQERRRYQPVCVEAALAEPRIVDTSAAQPVDAERVASAIAPASAEWQLSTETDAYLAEHRLRGCPLVPACVLLDRMAAHALQQFPGLRLIALEHCEFVHALRVPFGRCVSLRVQAERVAGASPNVTLAVSVRADVTTPDGRVLEADRRHAGCRVVLGAEPVLTPSEGARLAPNLAPNLALHVPGGSLVTDPYTHAASPLWLGESFDCLRELRVGTLGNRARYRPAAPGAATPPARVLPALLIDALLRLGVVRIVEAQPLDIYAPTFIERLSLTPGLAGGAAEREWELVSARARAGDGRIACAWVAAQSRAGEPALVLHGYRGQRVGSLPAPLPIPHPIASVESVASVASVAETRHARARELEREPLRVTP